MCWITTVLSNAQPKVAEEDITVFKVALLEDGKITSIYKNFPYEKGIVYDMCDSNCFGETNYKINEGYHSYSLDNSIIHECNGWGFYISAQFFYTFVKQYDFLTGIYASKIFVLCTIPKGSIYYLNEYGEYVSNSIRIDDYFPVDEKLIRKLRLTTIMEYLKEYKKDFI